MTDNRENKPDYYQHDCHAYECKTFHIFQVCIIKHPSHLFPVLCRRLYFVSLIKNQGEEIIKSKRILPFLEWEVHYLGAVIYGRLSCLIQFKIVH